MKKLLLLVLIIPLNVFAGAFVYSGDWRAEYGLYHNVDFGSDVISTATNTKDYMLSRFRLNPDFIVNDTLSIKSEWILLAGGLGTETNEGLIAGADDANMYLNKVWFEWISSFGVFTVGRVGFDFGLGIFFNSGANVWDYYSNNVDRIGYELKLGSISIGLAYDMMKEEAINNSKDEENAFLIKVIYERIDVGLEVGFMWYAHKDMPGYKINTYDFYQKKSFKDIDFDLNWEVVYQKGKTNDYDANGTNDSLQSFGLALEFLWYPNNFELGLKTGISSGDDGNNTDNYYGFSFNKNYKIALLIFNEDLGVGGDTVHGSSGIGADFDKLGAIYIAPNFLFSISDNLKLETVYIYARTQKKTNQSTKFLGSEIDFNLSYNIYDNFEAVFRSGLFFPSSRFDNRKTAVAMLGGLGVKF